MLKSVFGAGTSPAGLREGLDASAARLRETAHRVANATNGLGPDGEPAFPSELQQAGLERAPGEVDLEREMVELANEQIRFDASASLLQRVYAQLRSATRGA